MATKMLTICDSHMMATEEEIEGFTIPPITLQNGKQKTLDLCGECQNTITYTALVELAELIGASVGRSSSKATPVKEDIPPHLRSQCRFCERNDFKNQGRLMHERRAHTEELAKLEAEEAAQPGDMFHCDVCDTTLTGERSWNRHIESKRHLDNVAINDPEPELVDA